MVSFFPFIPLSSSLLSCLLCRLSFHAGLPLPLTSPPPAPHLSSIFSPLSLSHSFSLSIFSISPPSHYLPSSLISLSLAHALSWLPMCLCYGHTGSSCFILLKDQYGAAHLTGPGGFWVTGRT